MSVIRCQSGRIGAECVCVCVGACVVGAKKVMQLVDGTMLFVHWASPSLHLYLHGTVLSQIS